MVVLGIKREHFLVWYEHWTNKQGEKTTRRKVPQVGNYWREDTAAKHVGYIVTCLMFGQWAKQTEVFNYTFNFLNIKEKNRN